MLKGGRCLATTLYSTGMMRDKSFFEVCDAVRRLVDREQNDPLARCIADQLAIVLNSLLGLETLAGILTCAESA